MMNIKKKEILGIFFVLFLGSLLHFTFEWSGQNPLVGAFSAVNESTWEHLKMLFTPFLIYTIIEYFLFGKNIRNFWPVKLKAILIGMFTMVASFYTYKGILGFHFLAADIGTFILGIIFAFMYSYKNFNIQKASPGKTKTAGIIGWIILTALVALFTFYPPKIGLFLDPVLGEYGIYLM